MKRVAVYAGSFDPPTNGHLDVICRIQPLFDKLYLVVAENVRKSSMFSSEERVELLDTAIREVSPKSNFEVQAYSGLIVNFCKQVEAHVLIRGLRALSDFESEFQMATMNRRLDPGIETLHVMTDEKYFFVSSSLVKELAHHQASVKELVPPNVYKELQKRVKKKS